MPLSPYGIRSLISSPVPTVRGSRRTAVRHRDRKPGRGTAGEPHLGLHLGSAPVAACVVEVAGELHEEIGGQVGPVVGDRRSALRPVLPPRNSSSSVMADGPRFQAPMRRWPGTPQSGTARRHRVTQRIGMGRHVEAEEVAPHPTRHRSSRVSLHREQTQNHPESPTKKVALRLLAEKRSPHRAVGALPVLRPQRLLVRLAERRSAAARR